MTQFGGKVSETVRGVRELLLPHYGNAAVVAQKSAVAADVVTELDQKVEEYLRDEFQKIEPYASFVGEETGGDRSADRFWLVDPIDGTAHFVRGMPFCTTLVALIDKGEVVFGAVYDFMNDKMYAAEQGKGATMNGAPIRVSDRPFSQAYWGWETHLLKEENMPTFLKLLRKGGVSFKAVASGYEYSLIAEGKLDARITFDPWGFDYDFAACSLLVAEAGGRVANIGSEAYDYRNLDFIAANPVIFKELTEGPDAPFPIKAR